MSTNTQEVWIINGIPGAGKTTTARALAKHFDCSVHIEGDQIHELIISGKVLPGQEPREEEIRQIHLCVKNQCLLARSFFEAGFTPIIDYVIVNRDRVEEYKKHLKGISLFLVTLDPGITTALQRDKSRPEKTVAHMWTHLDQEIKNGLENTGLWIDNREPSIDEVVDHILSYKNQARV